MATRKQIEANRLNAQKSTGPRTAEGKAVSRFNALKTGIDAEYHAFSGENKSTLADLAAEYDREYEPMGTGERLIVDQLVKSDWFLRRYRFIASNLIEWGMQQAYFKKEGCELGDTFAHHLEAHRRIHRQILEEERAYHHNLALLEARQSARRAATDLLATSSEQTPSPQIGFVPPPTPDTPQSVTKSRTAEYVTPRFKHAP